MLFHSVCILLGKRDELLKIPWLFLPTCPNLKLTNASLLDIQGSCEVAELSRILAGWRQFVR